MAKLIPAAKQPRYGEEIFICDHLAAGRTSADSAEDLFHGIRDGRRVYPVYFRWRWWEGQPGSFTFRGRRYKVWFMAMCQKCWRDFDKQFADGKDVAIDGRLIFWYGVEPAVFLEEETVQ